MSNKVFIVGMHGPSGSGKDEMADSMIATIKAAGYEVVKYSFADPIKSVCKLVFGGTDDDYYTQEGKRSELPTTYGLTVRQLLQRVGTECFRKQIHENIWVDVFVNKIYGAIVEQDVPTFIIVPDVREAIEIEAIKKLGGVIVGIDPLFPEYKKLATTHSSENMHYDRVDFMYENSGSVEDAVEDAASFGQSFIEVFRKRGN